ncbi:LysM peptidoglycan-binding domain-containing protein [Jiella endophytica]|uniref:LysM peptidoglycan-binding domain-containing protein n=1 Tax=Jiella endophytica TaxID=2558362 RepID=A0A4Y8RCC8_9HYPH|nr:peptidoglycan DD-metalloendopeptidase family protein [Jiella endophytica]TFF19708.1 LysM peptidoglycan-binding domain-containing protein [Jiella endophytica]
MFGSVAAIAVAGLFAGCSSDVVRFDDGFYTGAVPQTPPMQQTAVSQPYPGTVDGTTTGAIAPASRSGGGYLASPASSGYPAGGQQMQRSQLPPPPEPSYQSQTTTIRSEPMATSAPQPVRAAQASIPATRGAPPSSLESQAQRLATPQARPINETRSASASNGSSAAAGSVTVVSGDTLLGIARKTGVSADAIRRANNLDSDTIRLGQTLMIPAGGKMPARSTEVAAAKNAPAAKPEVPAQKVAEVRTQRSPVETEKSGRVAQASEPAAPAVDTTATGSVKKEVEQEVAAVAPNSTGIGQFRWPVQGRVVNRYGEKVDGRRNDGVNISVPRGTPVKAAENGVVIYAGDGLKEFGNTVLVKHDDGLVTVYGHADTLAVKKGETVRRGEVIAQSGMSGDTDVPVLHFEVRKNSTPVDPMKFLQ